MTFKNHVNGHSKHFGEYEEEVNIETCTTILHEDKKEQALRGYVKLWVKYLLNISANKKILKSKKKGTRNKIGNFKFPEIPDFFSKILKKGMIL